MLGISRLHIDNLMTAQPISQCLAIHDGKPLLTNPKDFNHVDKIPLDHIPLKFKMTIGLFLDHTQTRFQKTT